MEKANIIRHEKAVLQLIVSNISNEKKLINFYEFIISTLKDRERFWRELEIIKAVIYFLKAVLRVGSAGDWPGENWSKSESSNLWPVCYAATELTAAAPFSALQPHKADVWGEILQYLVFCRGDCKLYRKEMNRLVMWQRSWVSRFRSSLTPQPKKKQVLLGPNWTWCWL